MDIERSVTRIRLRRRNRMRRRSWGFWRRSRRLVGRKGEKGMERRGYCRVGLWCWMDYEGLLILYFYCCDDLKVEIRYDGLWISGDSFDQLSTGLLYRNLKTPFLESIHKLFHSFPFLAVPVLYPYPNISQLTLSTAKLLFPLFHRDTVTVSVTVSVTFPTVIYTVSFALGPCVGTGELIGMIVTTTPFPPPPFPFPLD